MSDTARRERGILVPSLFTLIMLAVLGGLGVWQLERKAWKEDLIATLDRRLAAPPSPLPPSPEWDKLDQETDEFRRVSVRAVFRKDTEARVYTSGGGLRDDVKGPGYFAFAPATVSDGGMVVVNRGYVPNPNPAASLRPVGVPDGTVEIVGVLRWPERSGMFVSSYSERQDLWMVRDHNAMASRYGWGGGTGAAVMKAAPFYIELESPAPPGGVPRPAALTVKLRNDHLGYALTWFGLATVLLVSFLIWAVTRQRRAT